MKWLRDVDRWYLEKVYPHDRVFRTVARRLLGHDDLARDVVHDVVAELLADDRWRALPEPRAYILRAIQSRSISIIRRNKIVPMKPITEDLTEAFADDGPDAFSQLDDKEKAAWFEMAIAQIPEQSRKAFLMRRIEGMSLEEVTEALGTSASTIRKQVAHARALLREAFVEFENAAKAPDEDSQRMVGGRDST